jgi:cold shock CspA family protein
MLKGVIKNWDNSKGWGFIVTSEEEDLFFHVSDLDVTLKPNDVRAGMTVKFDVRQDMKGAKAVRVRKA